MVPAPFTGGLAELLLNLPLGVAEVDATGTVTYGNEAVRVMMSAGPEKVIRELLGRIASSAVHTGSCVEHAVALGQLGEVRMWAAHLPERGTTLIAIERTTHQRSRLESQLLSMLVLAATRSDTAASTAALALETLCASLPGTHMVLYEKNNSGQLVATGHAGLVGSVAAALSPIATEASATHLVARAYQGGTMLAHQSHLECPMALPLSYPVQPVLSAVALPVMGNHGARGVLYVCGPAAVLTEAEGRLLLKLTETLALLLEQKERDQRISDERDRFASLVSNLPDAVVEIEAKGTIGLAGGGTEGVFGLAPEFLAGQNLKDWLSPDDLARVTASGGPRELQVRAVDGRWRTVSATSHRAADGVTRVVLRDVSEQHRLRHQAQVALEAATKNEWLAVLGRLTSGVGHELNNPLSYLGTNLGSLRAELEAVAGSITPASADEMRAILDDCEEGVKRIAAIVQALKGSSTTPRQTSASFDPAAAIGNAITLFRGVHRHRAKVEWTPCNLPPVNGSATALAQVILNLLQSGLDAQESQKNATLTVAAAVHADQGNLIIEVTDGGRPVTNEHAAHIFEPFGTPRGEQAGPGLGLYLCKRLVTSMGGDVSVRSDGRQNTFSVHLPLLDDGPGDVAPAPAK